MTDIDEHLHRTNFSLDEQSLTPKVRHLLMVTPDIVTLLSRSIHRKCRTKCHTGKLLLLK